MQHVHLASIYLIYLIYLIYVSVSGEGPSSWCPTCVESAGESSLSFPFLRAARCRAELAASFLKVIFRATASSGSSEKLISSDLRALVHSSPLSRISYLSSKNRSDLQVTLALRFNGRIIAPSSLLVSSRACGSRKSSIFPFTAGPVRKFPLRAIQHAVTMSGLGRLGRHLTSEAAAPIQNNLEPHCGDSATLSAVDRSS